MDEEECEGIGFGGTVRGLSDTLWVWETQYIFLSPFFIVVLRVHCDIYKNSDNLSNVSSLNSPPPPFSTILLYSPPLFLNGHQVSFFHLHTCVHSICTIFTLLHPFPTSSLLPLVPTPQTGKKWHFCLFKIATQGVSLWHFHVYMNYNPNWLNSSIVLLSILVPFWWFQ
jgi:hypothetical protein